MQEDRVKRHEAPHILIERREPFAEELRPDK
jgi:hypothetical protein